MPIPRAHLHRLLAGLVFALLALAAYRGGALWAHQPMIALANNYDQVRYTACFDLYPYRPGIAPTDASYETPQQHFAIQPVADQVCYWTSELLFIAPVAWRAIWQTPTDGASIVSVRLAGALLLGASMVFGASFSRLWWRERRVELAVANAAFLALVAMDPANTIYLNTFYAEAAALLFLYSTICVIFLTAQQPRPWRTSLLTLSAFLLGMSKLQHMLLPLLLALAMWLVAAVKQQPWRRAVLALGCGGLAALGVQTIHSHRDNSLVARLALVNRADTVFSAVFPASADPPLTAQRLGLPAACLNYSGKSIYQIPVDPETACPGIREVGPGRILRLLGSEPGTLARMIGTAPQYLLPWIPDYLGLVAENKLAALPADFFSLDRLLRSTAMIWALLILPLLAMLPLLLRKARGASTEALLFATLCAVTAWSTLLVAVLGDGMVELAKHCHLLFSVLLAFALCLPLAALLRRWPGGLA